MKTSPTLLCIPDISGFTQFMREANFKLTSQVIPALLNEIIYANELDLKVSEIEGDAVLFYKSGDLPRFKELIDQCRNFYVDFYERLELLKEKYNENKDSDSMPEILGLKIILHYGEEIGMVPIGTHIKLMGEDVITAHRLLKNNLDISEYILITDALLSQYSEEEISINCDWCTLKKNKIEVEHLGTVKYHYIDLKPLSEK
ncbi:DUF2652 domain-containing protein [Flavimarina sp. Hel_I_48]|uniref:DUF2652 domain-containing protein n=1 Tax=Flavimarina sp. Hel_I_48 TaxID=1392488 RepID=UPI0004DF61C1|nr:DUF2652 domain-containing protein [Flavimarina sp. Hel_I_48]